MTRPFILPLSECNDLDLTGGKAVGLRQLIATGFSVPQGFCITTEAYAQSLRASGFIDTEEWQKVCALSEHEQSSALAGCRNRIKQAETSHLGAPWLTAIQALGRPSNARWAVRSSATNEDSGQTSFAGLYRTHLGVAPSEIDAALKFGISVSTLLLAAGPLLAAPRDDVTAAATARSGRHSSPIAAPAVAA